MLVLSTSVLFLFRLEETVACTDEPVVCCIGRSALAACFSCCGVFSLQGLRTANNIFSVCSLQPRKVGYDFLSGWASDLTSTFKAVVKGWVLHRFMQSQSIKEFALDVKRGIPVMEVQRSLHCCPTLHAPVNGFGPSPCNKRAHRTQCLS